MARENRGRTDVLKKIAAVVAIAAVALGVGACNTIEGAGKDVKAAGGAVEKAAGGAKRY
jgi:predicted small secreted protein